MKREYHGHGRRGESRTYMCWAAIKRRCNNKNTLDYKNYGGRGIKVCKRWERFSNFLADMGEKPKGLSIDRIDNNGHYTPENCRWATKKQQDSNRRSSRYLTYKGETKIEKEWARELGISYGVIRKRRMKGWPDEKILTTPVEKPYEQKKLRYKGITLNLADTAKKYNINESTLRLRLKKHGSVKKAIETPVRKYSKQ